MFRSLVMACLCVLSACAAHRPIHLAPARVQELAGADPEFQQLARQYQVVLGPYLVGDLRQDIQELRSTPALRVEPLLQQASRSSNPELRLAAEVLRASSLIYMADEARFGFAEPYVAPTASRGQRRRVDRVVGQALAPFVNRWEAEALVRLEALAELSAESPWLEEATRLRRRLRRRIRH